MPAGRSDDEEYTTFARRVEPRLSYAFAAIYGPDVGADVTADALIWGWEHWDRLRNMDNPTGYLYRVGRSKARAYRRRQGLFPQSSADHMPAVEPALPIGLAQLSKQQRASVVLMHALGCTEREAAELLGLSRSTVRVHAQRGLAKLREVMGVSTDA